MSEPELEKDKLIEKYLDIQMQIRGREKELEKRLNIDTVGIDDSLNELEERWRSGRKSLRSFPTIKLLEYHGDTDEDLEEILTSFDAIINCLDDIIDTENLSKENKIVYTSNIAFSTSRIADFNLQDEETHDYLIDYWTDIFQIPSVEEKLNNEIRESETRSEMIEAGIESYSYRAKDIDIFSDIGYNLTNLNTTKNVLDEDLRTYRARELLRKDIKDIERDRQDDDLTPVIEILENAEDSEYLLKEIYDSFEYEEDVHREILESSQPELEEVIEGSKYF